MSFVLKRTRRSGQALTTQGNKNLGLFFAFYCIIDCRLFHSLKTGRRCVSVFTNFICSLLVGLLSALFSYWLNNRNKK
ncbi:type I toxin-antitoxin system Fst family toxin [Enterococcus faecium]|uniref:type I toxin-antitoxin system Fst family toxin n=1 Tax=Enterococcus faecium TaxID=1352 RepID=UPI0039C614BC